MTHWQTGMIEFGDRLLGWTLTWPRDLTLLSIAAILSALLLAIRRWIGSSNRLCRVAGDERRLSSLMTEARLHGDLEAVQRHRRVRRLVAGQRLRVELLPALIGLLPMMIVVSWGAQRLDDLPLRLNKVFEFSVTVPASAIGTLVYVVPQSELKAEKGWVRMIELTRENSLPLGQATWQLRAGSSAHIEQITVRYGDTTLVHPIAIENPRNLTESIGHKGDVVTHLHLTTYHPFGLVPGLPALGLRPWLVGLLGMTVVCYFGMKRLLKIP